MRVRPAGGAKIELAAVDAQLALPQSKFSYLLQDWDQDFAMEHVDEEGNEIDGRPAIFGWISEDVAQRRGDRARPLVHIMAGQESLWNMRDVFQGDVSLVDIVDLLHGTPRLWDAAALFYSRGSRAAEKFVREPTRHPDKPATGCPLRILQGDVQGVIRGLRRMGTQRLSGKWDEFVAYRIEQETQRLYPYRDSLQPVSVSLAA